jgi:hypothetical protein
MDQYPRHEGDPSYILTLASSMAKRQIRETQWQHSVMSETLDMPPLQLERDELVDLTEAKLAALSNPSPDDEQQKVYHLANNAQGIADNHTVAVHEVFERDDLYSEFIRSRTTPQAYAEEEAAAAAGMYDLESGLNAEIEAKESFLDSAVESGEITEEEAAVQGSKFMYELLQDDELAKISMGLSLARQARHRLIARSIERYWGSQVQSDMAESLDQLAAEFELEASDQLSPTLRKLRAGNDVVTEVCAQNGWDPLSLTFEQWDAIEDSPQMRELLNKDESEF